MKYIRYSRYAPEAADDIDLQELMNRLSDFFLQSGFESQYGIYEMDMQKSREQHDGAAARGDSAGAGRGRPVPPEMMEQLLQNPDLSQNQELSDLIDQIIQRMEEEGLHFDSSSSRRA